MKKKSLTAAVAGLMCACVLCACGNEQTENSAAAQPASAASAASEVSAQGNQSAFNMDKSLLSQTLAGAWVSQSDYNDKIKFNEDLSFTHFVGAQRLSGKAVLNETGGLLELTYDNDARPQKSYVWVDSLEQLSANTWYVDGGTFGFGGVKYIKDMEI